MLFIFLSCEYTLLIIFPRVKPLKDFEHVISNEVLKRCIIPKIASKDLRNPTLIMDQAPCHCTNRLIK
ncbi:hypothetical protein BpHYR1_028355 [Brachionus plicatilis]|uniref:Uncharacterized protein n=1 Tax=Brachionus plicatilis TaxID=10195 RepID=A0A3M7QEI4_BRAPC|nr:hypothetical protein BpHYR1_028355 [Brachionus plicatilis]